MLDAEFPKRNIREFYHYYFFEENLKKAVESGDVELSVKVYNDFMNKNLLYPLASNEITSTRYHIICLIANLASIVINKGFSPYSVKAKSEAMIGLLDKQKSVKNIIHIGHLAVKGFATQVSTLFNVSKDSDIRTAINYIHDHLGEKLDLSMIAKSVYMSESYFCNKFKDSTGYTFSNYVNNARIEKSKILLAHTNKKISEISFALGFSNQSYYSTIFKKLTGQTPNEFRTENKGSYMSGVEFLYKDTYGKNDN